MIIQFMKPLFFGQLSDRLNQGGPVFTYPLVLMLFICIGLVAYAFLKGDETNKFQNLVSSISLFALVWGFLGNLIGLITAFDHISGNGAVSFEILAGGLKVGLLSPVFGMVVFLIARLGIIALIFKKNNTLFKNHH